MRDYDLVIIGTGTAASVAAHRCRGAGWRVAVVDHQAFGGTCALRGCDPKKVLVGAAEAVDFARRLHGKGVVDESSIAWGDLMRFKRTFTAPVPASRQESFAKAGIDAFHGRARFCDRQAIDIGSEVLRGRFVLIAAGAVPKRLGIPGEAHLITSTEFLELSSLPKRILLVGGGYIAAEFSHIAARAGSAVTIVQQGERLLKLFDPDLVSLLMKKFRELGIDVKLNAQVLAVESAKTGFVVRANIDGREHTLGADLVIHAAGRLPDLESLDLDKNGIETDKGRLKLNEFLQSQSNPAVYAAGDCSGNGPPLTPVASHEARVVAANMLEGNHHKPNYLGVPSVAFTIPPIAAAGLSEKQAREHRIKFRMQNTSAGDWYTARRVAETVYGFKVLVEESSERILGAHLVGPHADEVINIFALAIRHNLTARDLEDTIFSYPTATSDVSYMI